MNQNWSIYFRGGRKGYSLQKLERLFDSKALNVKECIGEWQQERVSVLEFDIPASNEGWNEAFLACMSQAVKLNPEWSITSFNEDVTFGNGHEESFYLKDIAHASWSLQKST